MKQPTGPVYALGVVFFEAWFPIAMAFVVPQSGVLSAYLYAMLIASLASWIWFVVAKGRLREVLAKPLGDLLVASLLAALLYLVLFMAILTTHPGHVALVLVLQLFFSFVFFQSLQEERIGGWHLVGAGLMLLGGMALLWPQGAANWGEWLIVFAAMLGPWLSFYQKKAKRHHTTQTILLARYGLGVLVVGLLMLLIGEQKVSLPQAKAWLWLIFLGVCVFVMSKWLWIEALMRMSITRLNALIVISPLATMGLDYWLFDYWPAGLQLFGLPLVFVGAIFLIKQEKPMRTIP